MPCIMQPADGAPIRLTAGRMPPVRSLSHFARRQMFHYFLILDFEATCDSGDRKIVNEIIEFPVLLVDGQSLDELSSFHQFVRPRICPTLSSFCVDLTGISQEAVDAAQPLPRVWNKFQSWLQEHELVTADERRGRSGRAGEMIAAKNFAFVTCGNWDLAVALRDDLSRYQLQQPDFMRKWINVKHSFRSVTGQWPAGLFAMLSVMGVQPVGRAHSGIADCRNTLLLMKKLAEKDHVFGITNQLYE